MAKCGYTNISGGGGLDTEELTASAADVMEGKKAGVQGSDEPVTGTMPDRGAVNRTLNAGGSYTIPAGYHNGGGKVTANSLASQTSGNASAGHILSGKTAWVNGQKVTGNIASMGGQMITPNAYSHTLSCSGKYMTGNVYVPAVSNLSAGTIKKGVTVGGVTGTFEGYVPTATDLYYRGNNVAGFSTDSYAVFDSGQITIKSGGAGGNRSLMANVNFTGYNYINFEGNFSGSYIRVTLGGVSAQVDISGNGVWSININSMQISGEVRILFYLMSGVCYRIWLS